MDFKIAKCKICGEDVAQEYIPKETKCDICGKNIISNYTCHNGHHMCSKCRFEGVFNDVKIICQHTKSKNPIEISKEIMNITHLPLLGCKHFFLTSLCLFTAFKNCGGKVSDFEKSLDNIIDRVMMVHTSECKIGGLCGIPASIGGAFQVVGFEDKTIEERTQIANKISGSCMAKLVNPKLIGTTNCCIRNSIICVVETSNYMKNYYWVDLELPTEIKCEFSEGNPRCNKDKCRFYSGIRTEKI
ncbi:MAG: DUF5714 domain-containing protein [Methanocorpusculum sp.]|nr:DUF5714 domain-containing protein [Methanocorpusculum sp.]